ncbi:type II toxin-antitoxin system RelE/ParE family toxin [Vandammella animalimorsus]|uniref:type II toxin-antitoxin system RelE/ParE family toxin n=1 Tax=Vandammella animalimorsus TaxID=2029117 RepID=UPI00325C1D6F
MNRPYIAADNPVRALSFVRELRAQCQRIALSPRSYRLRPELGKSIRSCAHGRYVIFFESDEHDAVLIVRILHGARDLPALFQAGEPGD